MLTDEDTLTLESFADTVLPGCKRHSDDRAIAGVSSSPGAVEAGALDVLQDPATGIADGIADMARLLNVRAAAYANEHDFTVHADTAFADLTYPHRRRLVARLTAPGAEMRDFWFLMALFSYMAYDSAPHLETQDALKQGHVGLIGLGFAEPNTEGVWTFEPASYKAALADVHPDTDERGNLP